MLRPGSPFVFFEKGAGGEALISALERSAAFDRVIADKQWATYALAKHSIGLAFRTGASSAGAAAAGGAALTGRAAAAAAFVAKTQQAKIQAALGGKMPSFDEEDEDEAPPPPADGEAPAAPATPPPQTRKQGKGKGGRRR